MNEQFEKWLNSKDHGLWPTASEVEFAEIVWNAAIESTKTNVMPFESWWLKKIKEIGFNYDDPYHL